MSIKVFGFSTFYVFFGFLTQKQVKIDQKLKKLKANNNQTKICQNVLYM